MAGVLDSDPTTGVGIVFVGNRAYTASFQYEGLNRRWDFGDDKNYAFFITPSGIGTYYDYSNTDEDEPTEPSQSYRCVLVGEPTEQAEQP